MKKLRLRITNNSVLNDQFDQQLDVVLVKMGINPGKQKGTIQEVIYKDAQEGNKEARNIIILEMISVIISCSKNQFLKTPEVGVETIFLAGVEGLEKSYSHDFYKWNQVCSWYIKQGIIGMINNLKY